MKGSVIDSVSGKPLVYVTVALQDKKTHEPVKSVLSKEDGSFELTGSNAKKYQLVLTFTGYTSKIIQLVNGVADTEHW